ncbi:hypothetical protein [Neolewinella antarctica]|uniref:ABC-type transporter Mla subunit MlaD n=1 Tax=Neolewinella antarctica TaxID=442734 RepID=A0ABX0XAY7_9BACT|nr:hypothetical protein [Neolewinella antarctica]NJC26382.1 ABC-type transporter Mla subunit MlaD [Neolewinella antarctica]
MSNQNDHLNSTIESLNRGLEKAKPGATRSLTSWVKALKDSKDEKLTKLADELQQLHDHLGKDSIDTAQVKKLMTSIGKHTTAAAKTAEGTTAEKISELGKALTDAAGSLK